MKNFGNFDRLTVLTNVQPLTTEIKKLASETALYGVGTILPRMLNFFLVALHTRVFKEEDYGGISELYGYVAFANIIFLFGMETAFFRFSNKEGMDRQRIFQLTQTVVLIISSVLSIIFLIFYQQIAQGFSLADKSIVIWIVLTMLVDAAVAIPFAQMRSQKKAVRFVSYKLVNIALLIGLNFYLLLYAGYESPGIGLVFLANFLANAVYLIFFFKSLISWKPIFDRKVSPQIFSYSYPLVFTGLAGMTNEMFSRIAIDNWLPNDFYPGKSSKYVQGIFSACYRFSVFMSLVVQAFRFAAEPFFFSKASDKNSPALFAKVNNYFILIACTCMVGICLNMEWIQYFIGPKYREGLAEGLSIVPVLLMGYIFLGIYYNISAWFKVTDRTHVGTIITVFGAAITIGLNYWLIPLYGIMGSACVTLICYACMAALCYIIGQRYYPMPYSIGKDIMTLIITTAIVWANYQIEIANQVLSIGLRGGFSVLIALIVYFIIFRKREMNL